MSEQDGVSRLQSKGTVLCTCAGYINSVVPDSTTAARRLTANILRNCDVLCANTRLYLVETSINMTFKLQNIYQSTNRRPWLHSG